MRSQNEHNELLESPNSRELKLLSEIEVDPEITQRRLASRVGMALGLTNLLLKNLAEKGYIKVSRSGWKRWLYTLIPRWTYQKSPTYGQLHPPGVGRVQDRARHDWPRDGDAGSQ